MISKSLAAANADVIITVSSDVPQAYSQHPELASTVSCYVTGTFVGTITFAGTVDGTNWVTLPGYVRHASGMFAGPQLSTTTGTGTFLIPAYGFNKVRARMTSYTSGTATVSLDKGLGGVPVQHVSTEGLKASYGCATQSLATVTSGTDVARLSGSATTTVRVTRITVSGTIDTAAQYVNVGIFKRTAAASGGTASQPSIGLYDSTNAAVTAVVDLYTGNPTTGAGILVKAQRVWCALSGTAAASPGLAVFEFGTRNSQSLVLRGVAQGAAVNLGTTGNAGVFDIDFEWTEEI
jgi:hypothetical protein